MSKKHETLASEFPWKMAIKSGTGIKDWKTWELANARRFMRILRFVVKNKCRLEHRNNRDSDVWRSGTLREFLDFALSVNKGDDPDNATFQDYLDFWRIKRTPTPSELDRLVTIDNKEEL